MSKEAILRFLDKDLEESFPQQTRDCLKIILDELKTLFSDEIRENKTSAQLLEYLFQLRDGENGVKYTARRFFTKAKGGAIERRKRPGSLYPPTPHPSWTANWFTRRLSRRC